MLTINLGDIVADRISGFAGMATGRTEYLYRTDMIEITPQELMADGSLAKGQWFNLGQVISDQAPESVGFRPNTASPVDRETKA